MLNIHIANQCLTTVGVFIRCLRLPSFWPQYELLMHYWRSRWMWFRSSIYARCSPSIRTLSAIQFTLNIIPHHTATASRPTTAE